MKYVLTFILSVILAGISLYHWSEEGTIGVAQILGVFIMYIVAPLLITYSFSQIIKDLKNLR